MRDFTFVKNLNAPWYAVSRACKHWEDVCMQIAATSLFLTLKEKYDLILEEKLSSVFLSVAGYSISQLKYDNICIEILTQSQSLYKCW